MLNELLSLSMDVGSLVTLALALMARVALSWGPSLLANREERRQRLRFAYVIVLVHLGLLLSAWALKPVSPGVAESARVGAALSGTLANVVLVSIVVFEGLVARVRPSLPRIVPDLVTTGAALVALIRTSSQLGFELSGVIATSAVLTAVIGLALQDTLGNALGGVALQLDRSLRVGDWIRINDIWGCVTEIHWRYTAVETNGWETVIIPNSALMRSQVVVLGRRRGESVKWRRQVTFDVPYDHAPSDVFRVIERALAQQPIQFVATAPAPHCVAIAFENGLTRFAARYWLTNPASEAMVESQVRNRVFYALKRADIGIGVPLAALTVTSDDQELRKQRHESEQRERLAALKQVELFSALSEGELDEVASNLQRAPYAPGEVVTREGADAKHLYIVREGRLSVRVGGHEEEREVAQLSAGSIFGEMALLTGERRNATLVALSDVECFRLDAAPFRALLAKHPDLAERVAQVLAERETALMVAKQRLNAVERESLHVQNKNALAARIRAFFELD
ncbi:MAG TPA: mechanosensitive ion channel family protein [Polyangiales bacterium]